MREPAYASMRVPYATDANQVRASDAAQMRCATQYASIVSNHGSSLAPRGRGRRAFGRPRVGVAALSLFDESERRVNERGREPARARWRRLVQIESGRA
eukprot:938999-Pleurochrysis_carterae.AAC.1